MYRLTIIYSDETIKVLYFFEHRNALKHVLKSIIDLLAEYYDIGHDLDNVPIQSGYWLYGDGMVETIDNLLKKIDGLDDKDTLEYPISYTIEYVEH